MEKLIFIVYVEEKYVSKTNSREIALITDNGMAAVFAARSIADDPKQKDVQRITVKSYPLNTSIPWFAQIGSRGLIYTTTRVMVDTEERRFPWESHFGKDCGHFEPLRRIAAASEYGPSKRGYYRAIICIDATLYQLGNDFKDMKYLVPFLLYRRHHTLAVYRYGGTEAPFLRSLTHPPFVVKKKNVRA